METYITILDWIVDGDMGETLGRRATRLEEEFSLDDEIVLRYCYANRNDALETRSELILDE